MRFKSDAQRRAAFGNMFSKKNTTWLVFGDSIAMGYNDPKGGWVQRLKEDVYPEPVYNLGVDGDCIGDVADRIIGESSRRIKPKDNANIILAVGLNDSKEESSEGGDKFKRLLDVAGAFADKKNITVVGLTPVDDSKVNPVAWDEDVVYADAHVKDLDGDIEKICDKNGITYVNVRDGFDRSDLDDGLHPNASGHDKIFDAIRETV